MTSKETEAQAFWSQRRAERLRFGDAEISEEEREGMDARQRAQVAERPFLRRRPQPVVTAKVPRHRL